MTNKHADTASEITSISGSSQTHVAEEIQQMAFRLDGGVSPLTLQEELIAHGCPRVEASAIVAQAQRRSLVRTGLKCLLLGCAGVAIGAGLMAWSVAPRSGALSLVLGLAYAMIGVWRLLRAALPGRGRRMLCSETVSPTDELGWLCRTIDRECESRSRVLKAFGGFFALSVVAAPLALFFWLPVLSLRRRRSVSVELIRRKSETLTWCYLKQNRTYGVTFVFLMLGVVRQGQRGRLIELPIPEADAERVLEVIARLAPQMAARWPA
jgi:hypothetical protein